MTTSPRSPAADTDGIAWVEAQDGYALALSGGKLVARNPQGKALSSLPKKLKDSELAEQLLALRDWLAEHQRECHDAVETWMIRSLPAPRTVIESVWDDPAWRGALENAVVVPIAPDGSQDGGAGGFLKGVAEEKGVGVVDLDGETRWLSTELVAFPHPILLPDLDGYRELATELSLSQGISQLLRETFAKAGGLDPASAGIRAFSEGKFEQLNHALGRCRTLGYRVRGGFAICPVWRDGSLLEARYWIGAEAPESETYTGELLWVDDRERLVKLGDVNEVAFSEGMRMAAAIYAGRAVEKEGEGA
jgi:hypothetical protein